MIRLLLVFCLAAGTASACNSYDPDLGDVPFRCGAEGECPDGYACGMDQMCRKSAGPSATADAGSDVTFDARPFQCMDDSELEPNNDLGTATLTPIPDLSRDYRLVGLSICPDTDVDMFRFSVTAQANVAAEIDYLAEQGELIVEIINNSGTSIREGRAVSGNANQVRAEIPNMLPGIYYMSVRAPAGIRNNYSLEIRTSE